MNFYLVINVICMLDLVFLQYLENSLNHYFLVVIYLERLGCVLILLAPGNNAFLIRLAGDLGFANLNAFDFTVFKVSFKIIPTYHVHLLQSLEHHYRCEYRNCDYKVAKRSSLITRQRRFFALSVLWAATNWLIWLFVLGVAHNSFFYCILSISYYVLRVMLKFHK